MSKKRAGIYGRISDDREGRRYGVDRQTEDSLAALERFHKEDLRDGGEGYELMRIWIDNDISASTLSKKPRPEFEDMMRIAEGGGLDLIVSPTSSRLTRRPLENERLISLYQSTGTVIRYCKANDNDLSTARGRSRARDDARRDAEEAEEISERVSRTARQRAEQGRPNGGKKPYGWRRDNRNKLDPYEHAIKLEMVERLLAGEKLRAVARDLSARGVPPPMWRPPLTIRPWSPASIREMLTNPRQHGARLYKGALLRQGTWEIALDELTVSRLRRLLLDPTRQTSPGGARKYVLTSLARCATCPDRFTAHSSKKADEPTEFRYWCKTCGIHRKLEPIELYVEAYMKRLLRNYKPTPDPTVDPAANDLVDELRARIDELIERYAESGPQAMTYQQYEATLRVLNRRLGEAEAAATPPPAPSLMLDGLIGENPRYPWDTLPLDRKRAVVNLLVEVTILRVRPGRRPFDPDSVVIERR